MLKSTARATGVWYLGVAISGALGFLMIRNQLFVAGDAAKTLANVQSHLALARIGVATEIAVVATQAMAALWFYKLYAGINRVAAVGVLAFGLMNCVAIMMSAVLMATIVSVVGNVHLSPGGDVAATVALLVSLSNACWSVGGLFFGLWLVPMGWVAFTSGRFPKALGLLLMTGAAGYIVATFLAQLWGAAPKVLLDMLPMAATVGEFWMIGYLLSKGVRGRTSAEDPGSPAT